MGGDTGREPLGNPIWSTRAHTPSTFLPALPANVTYPWSLSWWPLGCAHPSLECKGPFHPKMRPWLHRLRDRRGHRGDSSDRANFQKFLDGGQCPESGGPPGCAERSRSAGSCWQSLPPQELPCLPASSGDCLADMAFLWLQGWPCGPARQGFSQREEQPPP